MAQRTFATEFEFLLNSQRTSAAPELFAGAAPELVLKQMRAHFHKLGMHVYAVELSTDEVRREGLFAVRVIVPELQPIAFHYRARYLGHDRLCTAPRVMGYPQSEIKDFNPWPMPFA